jgi:hypothetical protein
MSKLTPEQFAQMVKAAGDSNWYVKNVRTEGFWVIANVYSKSRKSASEWRFFFDAATGDYKYGGPYSTANQPVFFADAIRKAIKGITGA